MLLIWGRIVIDVMGHWVAIDHMVQQRFYQSGGITAPPHAVEGGTKWTFWPFDNRSGYGAVDHSILCQGRDLWMGGLSGAARRKPNVGFTPKSGRKWVWRRMSAYDPKRPYGEVQPHTLLVLSFSEIIIINAECRRVSN